jgi:hypothetical protein
MPEIELRPLPRPHVPLKPKPFRTSQTAALWLNRQSKLRRILQHSSEALDGYTFSLARAAQQRAAADPRRHCPNLSEYTAVLCTDPNPQPLWFRSVEFASGVLQELCLSNISLRNSAAAVEEFLAVLKGYDPLFAYEALRRALWRLHWLEPPTSSILGLCLKYQNAQFISACLTKRLYCECGYALRLWLQAAAHPTSSNETTTPAASTAYAGSAGFAAASASSAASAASAPASTSKSSSAPSAAAAAAAQSSAVSLLRRMPSLPHLCECRLDELFMRPRPRYYYQPDGPPRPLLVDVLDNHVRANHNDNWPLLELLIARGVNVNATFSPPLRMDCPRARGALPTVDHPPPYVLDWQM